MSSTTVNVAIIGAGPAGLMAAETLAEGGAAVTVYDAMPSAGRKFLMAGRGGLNLTHSEALPEFLGAADQALAKEAAKQFKKQGLDIHVGVKVGEVTTTDNSVTLNYTDKDGNAQKLEADRLIVSIGRDDSSSSTMRE